MLSCRMHDRVDVFVRHYIGLVIAISIISYYISVATSITGLLTGLDLYQSVGFNGNGYVELPANLVNYENLEREPAVIALRVNTVQDGVLAYQREALAPIETGDYLMIRSELSLMAIKFFIVGTT